MQYRPGIESVSEHCVALLLLRGDKFSKYFYFCQDFFALSQICLRLRSFSNFTSFPLQLLLSSAYVFCILHVNHFSSFFGEIKKKTVSKYKLVVIYCFKSPKQKRRKKNRSNQMNAVTQPLTNKVLAPLNSRLEIHEQYCEQIVKSLVTK